MLLVFLLSKSELRNVIQSTDSFPANQSRQRGKICHVKRGIFQVNAVITTRRGTDPAIFLCHIVLSLIKKDARVLCNNVNNTISRDYA